MSTMTGHPTGSLRSITGTEEERGTWIGTRHHHNGYYAGDFSDRPFPTAPLGDLMALRSGGAGASGSAGSPASTVSTVGGGW